MLINELKELNGVKITA